MQPRESLVPFRLKAENSRLLHTYRDVFWWLMVGHLDAIDKTQLTVN